MHACAGMHLRACVCMQHVHANACERVHKTFYLKSLGEDTIGKTVLMC